MVLLSNQGAEVTDVLAPYEVFSESGAFNVYAAAPERKAVTLSGGLDILPQLSLSELDRRLGGEDPDVIVVPEMSDIGSPGHRPVAEWLREHAEESGTVVSGRERRPGPGRRGTAGWPAGHGQLGEHGRVGEALPQYGVGAGAALRRGRERAHSGRSRTSFPDRCHPARDTRVRR